MEQEILIKQGLSKLKKQLYTRSNFQRLEQNNDDWLCNLKERRTRKWQKRKQKKS